MNDSNTFYKTFNLQPSTFNKNKFGQLIDASFRPIFQLNSKIDQQAYLPVEMQFYISGMFPGLPDDIHEEEPSFFCNLKNALTTD